MTDRQFLRQLLLAHLVKQASRRRRSDDLDDSVIDDALWAAIPGLLGGGGAGFAGYRYGGRALDVPIGLLSRGLAEHNKEVLQEVAGRRMGGLGTFLAKRLPWLTSKIPGVSREYAQAANPRQYTLSLKLLQSLAKRPALTAGLAGAGGALAAGGLGHLIHSLIE